MIADRKMRKNRKADISITLLVVMVLVVCIVALFKFYLAGSYSGSTLDDYKEVTYHYAEYEVAKLYLQNMALDIVAANPSITADNFKEEFKKGYIQYYLRNSGYINKCSLGIHNDWKDLMTASIITGEDSKKTMKFTIPNFNFICEIPSTTGIKRVDSNTKLEFSIAIP